MEPDTDDEGEKQERDGRQDDQVPLPEGPGAGDDPAATAADRPAGADRSAAGRAEKGSRDGGFPRFKVFPQRSVDIVLAVAVRIRAFSSDRHLVRPDEIPQAVGTTDLQQCIISSPGGGQTIDPDHSPLGSGEFLRGLPNVRSFSQA